MHMHHDMHKIHMLKDELSEVYLNLSIQSFALSLISVFIPIYLLKIGYLFNEMVMFFIIYHITLGLVSPVCATLANRFGFKHIILIRAPLLLAFILGLNNIEVLHISIYLLAVIGGTSASLYWNSINSIFAKNSNKIHRGNQTGKLISMPKIASLAGPTIGGAIALFFGFKALFITTAAFIIISFIPLFFTKDTRPHVNFSFRKMIKIKKNLKYLIYFALEGAKSITGYIFWPLFIYWGLQGSMIGTGFSQTITSIGIIAFTLYIGRRSDQASKRSMIRYGGLLFGLLWFVRIFSSSPVDYFILSFVGGFFVMLIDLPFMAMAFDAANTENPDEFVVFREISINIGKISIMGLTLLATGVISQTYLSFSLAGIASLAFIFF